MKPPLITGQQYIAKQKDECAQIWFEKHRALWSSPESIRWQNPESWTFGCIFIIHRRWLTVIGDIGEAVYEWSQDISPHFLLSLDFGYFHRKCCASEVGTRFDMWNSEVASFYLAEKLQDLRATPPGDQSSDYKKELEIIEDLVGNDGKQEFAEAAQNYYDATGDGEGASNISDMGTVPHARCIGHFVGLQMALKQLV